MNKEFMKRAIELARASASEGEIPVGAVIVKDGKIVGEGRNMREGKKSALSHAEIEAIVKANKALGDWRLDGCEMYVTLEPCLMCTGAIINSRISRLVFGAFDIKNGAIDSKSDIINKFKGAPIEVFCGICEDECAALLKDFFEEIR